MNAAHRRFAAPPDKREPWALRYTGALIVTGIVATVTVAILGVFVLPRNDFFVSRTLHGRDQFDAQNQVRDMSLKLAGGIAAAFAAFVTWGRIELARSQHATEVSGQLTDRFSQAIEHIGSADPSVRLGGLYALFRIAGDSPPDRHTAYQVISAFVRYRTSPAGSNDPNVVPVDSEDVRAALRMLASDRPWPREEMPVELAGAQLAWAKLAKAKFDGSSLRSTNLDGADLRGADLRNADLSGAHLFQADLSGVDLTNALLIGADLREAKLRGSVLNGADLTEADLSGADLTDDDNAVRDPPDRSRADQLGLRSPGLRFDDQTHWPAGFTPSGRSTDST